MSFDVDRRVFGISLDAFEPLLLRRFAAEGELSALQGLLDSGFAVPTSNPAGLMGAVWPSVYTGLDPGHHGRFYYVQAPSGSYRETHFSARNCGGEPFWHALSRAGKRVCVFDVPKTAPWSDLNGLQLSDWSSHDPEAAGFCTHPPELAAEVLARFGPDPAGPCEGIAQTEAGLRAFLARQERRIARKREVIDDLLEHGPWDFFLASFAAAHCIGHLTWHLHDPTHPRHDPELAARLGDPFLRIYKVLDAAVGSLLQRLDPGDRVVLMCPHGMGPYYGMVDLLDEVLRRAEVSADDQGASAGSGSRKAFGLARRAWNMIPGWVRNWVPPEDLEAVCDHLVEVLRELRNVDTGKPAVSKVHRSRELYPGPRLDDLPDLMIEWDRDTPIRAIESPRIGRVEGEIRDSRTGDHRANGEGLFVFRGPGIAHGSLAETVPSTRVATTLSRLLGVDLEPLADAPVTEVFSAALAPPPTRTGAGGGHPAHVP